MTNPLTAHVDRAWYLARAYIETIHGAPNAWGQHVHKELGRSDYIMQSLHHLVGAAECNRLLDAAEADRLNSKDQL